MTARLLLLAALCAAGCATRSASVGTNGGGGQAKLRLREPNTPGLTGEQVEAALAPADSSTLTFTAPRYGHYTCTEADSAKPLRDPQWCEVWKLNEAQPPNYRRGCEADTACWDSVRTWNAPRVVWAAWAAPGARCSVRVASGLYAAMVRGQRCAGWRIVRVGN